MAILSCGRVGGRDAATMGFMSFSNLKKTAGVIVWKVVAYAKVVSCDMRLWR